MELERLEALLSGFSRIRVLVLGDYFLDQYLIINPGLAEISIETGLEACQVTAARSSPGAAGTVCSNLAALGVKTRAIGIIGQDGNGFELLQGLHLRGIDTELMIESRDRLTPTYTKPMNRRADGTEVEMERIDIRSRSFMPTELQAKIIENLWACVATVDGVIVGDQFEEEECGVVTAAVRDELARLSRQHPDKIFFADSRRRIGRFSDVIIKPNEHEAKAALGVDVMSEDEIVQRLFGVARKPVFLTCGRRGIYGFDGRRTFHCPAVPVSGPIDIVGAGDSASAGIVSALCAGATLEEAGQIGNLVASVTIRKLGTTGTASPHEVRDAWKAMLTG